MVQHNCGANNRTTKYSTNMELQSTFLNFPHFTAFLPYGFFDPDKINVQRMSSILSAFLERYVLM
jgi:hypothetical protein